MEALSGKSIGRYTASVGVTLRVANEAEAMDHFVRFRNMTGVPPHDVIRRK